jgi:hypothetical protein
LLSLATYNVHSERQLKYRISRWGIEKNCNKDDMRTALQRLVDSGSQDAYPQTKFRIRARIVTLEQVLAYFRRRHIHDPFQWLVAQQGDGFEMSCHVTLLAPDMQISGNSSPNTATPLEFPITSPQQQTIDQLLAESRTYCRHYLTSGVAQSHIEPQVHHDTDHGQFGHRMQDGIFYLSRGDLDLGFQYFHSAFGLVPPIIKAASPMSLAQIAAIICELLFSIAAFRQNAVPNVLESLAGVLGSLLGHLSDLAKQYLGRSHSLVNIFSILQTSSEHKADLVLTFMRVMQAELGVLSSSAHYWQRMYIQERCCDCLYHARYDGERQNLRKQLLDMQEPYYGPNRSNVLWTMTNVADDALQAWDIDAARKTYLEVIERSHKLVGAAAIGKAQYAAYEGLARTNVLQADLDDLRARLESRTESRIRLLDAAADLLLQADHAVQMSKGHARRRSRVQQARKEILTEVASLRQLIWLMS